MITLENELVDVDVNVEGHQKYSILIFNAFAFKLKKTNYLSYDEVILLHDTFEDAYISEQIYISDYFLELVSYLKCY